jgi:hypothetical protein
MDEKRCGGDQLCGREPGQRRDSRLARREADTGRRDQRRTAGTEEDSLRACGHGVK